MAEVAKTTNPTINTGDIIEVGNKKQRVIGVKNLGEGLRAITYERYFTDHEKTINTWRTFLFMVVVGTAFWYLLFKFLAEVIK